MKARGFSLIEVMVVLVILSLTATFVTVGFERLESDRLEQQAGQISSWLQAVSDDAVLDGAVYGAWPDPAGERLQVGYFYDNRWWVVDDDELSSPRLAEETVLLLAQGNDWRALPTRTAAERFQPVIIFLPVGSTRPGRLLLRYGDDTRHARIEQDADGIFVWQIL